MSHEVFQNYINGQWVGSSAVIENINPSDTSDVVGHYAKASSGRLPCSHSRSQYRLCWLVPEWLRAAQAGTGFYRRRADCAQC